MLVLSSVVSGPRWRPVSLALIAGASVGFLAGGAVAATALGAYGVVAVVLLRRRRLAAARRAARSALLDRLTGLAADLRAGVPIQAAARDSALVGEADGLTAARGGARSVLPDRLTGLAADLRAGVPIQAAARDSALVGESGGLTALAGGAGGLTALAGAAVALAERTGAPLAELIDRIEADARAGDRARAAAIAQAAGAQATALLLAALPVGGLALGYAIGADPLAILLGTPLGAICALCGVVLQILGLVWSQRLQPRLP
ncbi:hypothetical protein Air01nite_40230 [Asanoa iriomotensis]|uniref:Tight adherence protein B n=1 Tax=Asanoa iriomotensis TaxID=234613 RepID=A0ABQ4C578_9ACTN|nr:hypothetical protein Air01nite_40230 [Asanoa iriomotensis]